MEEYKSQKELYHRLLPALKVKKRLIQHENYIYIRHEDIWDYLSSMVWRKKVGLTLYDMTSDIINVDIEKVNDYLKNKIKNEDRIIV